MSEFRRQRRVLETQSHAVAKGLFFGKKTHMQEIRIHPHSSAATKSIYHHSPPLALFPRACGGCLLLAPLGRGILFKKTRRGHDSDRG
ncbi:MAG: hypothetical protein RLY93_13575 [Sumerlaeia bacterium]